MVIVGKRVNNLASIKNLPLERKFLAFENQKSALRWHKMVPITMRPLFSSQKNQCSKVKRWFHCSCSPLQKPNRWTKKFWPCIPGEECAPAQDIHAGDNMDKRKSVYLLLVWLSLSWPGSADKLQVMWVSSGQIRVGIYVDQKTNKSWTLCRSAGMDE